jgi:hypothetical protein
MAEFADVPELSITIQLLNEFSTSQIAALRAHILSKGDYKLRINPKNVDEDITPEEISSFTSTTVEDGKLFYDCYIV